MDPTIDRAKAKWAEEGDAQLTSAVKKHGKNWVAVEVLVRGRTKSVVIDGVSVWTPQSTE